MRTIKFEGIHANEASRYATDWSVETEGNLEKFRVSSVNNSFATETMLFPIMEDGIDYSELWVEREFYTNPTQQFRFLNEFLENR
tara:strand:+ start:458 stop:712 length:255 start_codon:yes stop_codon:yes gene_type:complete